MNATFERKDRRIDLETNEKTLSLRMRTKLGIKNWILKADRREDLRNMIGEVRDRFGLKRHID